MFNFFRRRKPVEEKELKFDDLNRWLNENEQIKSIISQFQLSIKECFSQLNNNFDKIEIALQDLGAISLENKKADERIKNLVLQNKTAYIGHVKRLISRLKEKIEATNLENLEDIENFASQASDHLANFSKHSFKAFHMTSELIGRELEVVVNCITAINSSIQRIKKIDKEKIRTIGFIQEGIEDISEKEKIINNLKTDISNKQEQKHNFGKQLLDAEKKNREIKTSPEWKEKQALETGIKILNKKLEENSSSVLALFLSIEKAFKKWAWKEKNDKILVYLEKPFEMIKQDPELKIVNIIDQIKQDVHENQIGLEEKRKDQMLKALSLITKEKLVSFIENEKQIKEEIQNNKKKLSNYNIQFIDLNKLTNQKNELISELKKLERRQNSLEKEISAEKDDIETSLRKISDVKLIK